VVSSTKRLLFRSRYRGQTPNIKEYWCSQSWCERTCEGKNSLCCLGNANTFPSLDSLSTDRAASAAKGSQDQPESEAHFGTQIQPHLQIFDTLHTGVRYAADSFIHLLVCLTTVTKPLPKRALHIVRSRASSFRCVYPLPSLRTSSSFLRLLPRLPVTCIPTFIFPSITCRKRQFLCNM
jgi:hypothetical protein